MVELRERLQSHLFLWDLFQSVKCSNFLQLLLLNKSLTWNWDFRSPLKHCHFSSSVFSVIRRIMVFSVFMFSSFGKKITSCNDKFCNNEIQRCFSYWFQHCILLVKYLLNRCQFSINSEKVWLHSQKLWYTLVKTQISRSFNECKIEHCNREKRASFKVWSHLSAGTINLIRISYSRIFSSILCWDSFRLK